MIIRNYIRSDQEQIQKIHFETGLLGKSMGSLISQAKLFDEDIDYYFKHEPESIFVAVDQDVVIGYLLGCLSDSKYPQIKQIIFILFKNLIRLPFLHKRDRVYCFNEFSFLLKVVSGKSGEKNLRHPEEAGHIHINLLPRARGKGIGSKLLERFVDYAKSKGVRKIHADSFQTRLNPNGNFWLKNGFKEYSKVKTLFWEFVYPKEEIFSVCYVRKLWNR